MKLQYQPNGRWYMSKLFNQTSRLSMPQNVYRTTKLRNIHAPFIPVALKNWENAIHVIIFTQLILSLISGAPPPAPVLGLRVGRPRRGARGGGRPGRPPPRRTSRRGRPRGIRTPHAAAGYRLRSSPGTNLHTRERNEEKERERDGRREI